MAHSFFDMTWLWKAKPDSLPQFQVSIHLQVVFLYTLQSSEMMDLPCISWFCRGWSLQSNRITFQPTFSLFQNPVAYRSDIFTFFFAPFCDISSGPFQRSRNSLLFFLSYICRVPYLLCDASVLSSRLVYSVKFLEGTVVNLFLQVNVDLRCRMVTWVYLDVLIYFELFLQVNMDLRCRIVTWCYLDVLIYFKLFLQVNLHLRCRMVTWFYLVFIIYFEVFLQVNVDLRCRMVTRVYLDVLIYFKLFLQVNMDLRCRMVTCIYLDFIFYVFLSCFCKEIWTSGIWWLHDFYTCAELISHWQEANLKTSNIYFYIYWISRIFQ